VPEAWAKGKVDKAIVVVTALPIDEAKKELLERNVKAKSGPEAEKAYTDSKLRFSDASSGRMATDRKR